MAIQQVIDAELVVIGDGTETVFSFRLRDVYGLYFPPIELGSEFFPFSVLHENSIPDGVTLGAVVPPAGTSEVSILKDTITITFGTPPAGRVTIVLNLLFNGA
mgnify:CR=1 FL=1